MSLALDRPAQSASTRRLGAPSTRHDRAIGWDNSASTELRLGTPDGGVTVARSFLTMDLSAIQGRVVSSAELWMYQHHSYSCSAREWQVWSAATATTATRWTSQPRWSTKWATSTDTRGWGTGCADGWSVVPITSLAQVWAGSTVNPQGIGLMAASETDSYGWKRFSSGNANSGKPTIFVTYNTYPSTPQTSTYQTQYAWWPSSSDPNRVLYVKDTTPDLSAKVADADGGTVRAQFDVFPSGSSTPVWNKVGGSSVASGSVSVLTSASLPALTDGATYTAQSWAYDGALRSKAAQSMGSFIVDVTAPATPTTSATTLTNGSWLEQRPSSNTFTFKTTSTDVARFEYSINGSAWATVPGTISAGSLSWSWLPAADGAYTLQVRAVDKAGHLSAIRKTTFGVGGASMATPATGQKTTDTFQVTATGPTSSTDTVTPTVQWRVAGGPATGAWTTVTATLPTIAAGQPVSVTHKWSAADVAETLGKSRVPLSLDVQVCFAYSPSNLTRCTHTADPTTVTRVPHAFGDSFPVADAGPGQVALWTGEFNTAVTDVSVPGYVGDLSVSRTYSTLADPTTASVFGPGWRASFDGTDIGIAGWEVIDSSTVDGSIALVDDQGEALIYRQPGTGRAVFAAGTYTPLGDTAEAGATLTLTGTGSAARLVFTQDDGTATVFAPVNYSSGTPTWGPLSVVEPGGAGATTFTRDTTGRVTRILAPTPPGVTCPATGALVPGCRALHITYATTTTATSTAAGDVAGQVKSISYEAYDPARQGGPGMATVAVATYRYDASKRLTEVTDPRTGLSTKYAMSGTSSSGQPLLTQVTPPGLAPFTLTYGTSSQDAQALLTVTRTRPGGGTATLARFVYGVPVTGTTGLPTMTSSTVAAWGQSTVPTYAAAVFGPDRPLTTSSPGSLTAADWEFASVQYTDAEGRVLNTAVHGAGAWQLTATGYDSAGRVVRSLDARAIDTLRGLPVGSVDPDQYATVTAYNTDQVAPAALTVSTTDPVTGASSSTTIAAGQLLTAAGTLVTDTWGPVTEVTRPDGSVAMVRVHSATTYDQGAPNSGISPASGQPFRLPTTVTVSEVDPAAGPANPLPGTVLSIQRSGYDPIDGAGALSATSGWVLGSATTSSTVNPTDASDVITTRTRYDEQGRVVETRQPTSSGTDAGTTLTTYYTTAANPTVPACGNAPQWAGLVCQVAPADAAAVPTITTGQYSMYLAPAVVTETLAGAVLRTTTTTFDSAGRVVQNATDATVGGSADVPPVVTEYDEDTGLVKATVTGTGTEAQQITTDYDTWGRATSYTDTHAPGQAGTADVTLTEYDTAGRVASVTDPTGAVTYGYDGPGEHRGLVTSLAISGGGTFTAAYDAAGHMTTQTYTRAGATEPSVVQTSTVDRTGQETRLAYAARASDATLVEAAAFEATYDAQGRIATASGTDPDGERDQVYGYDHAARLVSVTDTTASGCAARSYTFDANGNRQTQATGPCGQAPATTRTWDHDAADRVQTGANDTGTYAYDALGRQTTIPGVDTPAGAPAGDLTLGYFDTDAAHTLTQNEVTTTYELDPAGRRKTSTTTAPTGTTSVVRGYADSSDNPAWATTTGPEPVTTRYAASIAGDLGLTITGQQVVLAVADMHGTIATTLDLTTTVPDPGGFSRYDEYGNTLTVGPATGTLAYGWLGAKERATDTTGLLLMGARLYNPTTGLFTSVDPVVGGNTTAYTYPQDPVNKSDLDGQRSWWSRNWKWVAAAAVVVAVVAVCVFATAACGVAASAAVRVGASLMRAASVARTSVSIARTARAGGDLARYGAVSQRTANLAGRLYTGWGRVASDGFRYSRNQSLRYRAPAMKRDGQFVANFERTMRPGMARSSWHYPRRTYNGHLSVRR